ncbi:unnamed protein product [Amoebophrya sp. A120]|nr:unnamed protein product [Amoebophrya sp. A120]|eukprot:GSA120T00005615001.1
MLEVWLPAVGCCILGTLKGIQHSFHKRGGLKLAAIASAGVGGVAYIKIYRGDQDWFRYVPYAKQPTYLKKNFPFYVSSYCLSFCGAYATREGYVKFMSRYMLPK